MDLRRWACVGGETPNFIEVNMLVKVYRAPLIVMAPNRILRHQIDRSGIFFVAPQLPVIESSEIGGKLRIGPESNVS